MQFDALGRLADRTQRDTHWLAHVIVYQSRDRSFQCRREAQRLAMRGQRPPTMRRIAGKKPISNMRSASSSTSVYLLEVDQPGHRKSSRRPGVATIDPGSGPQSPNLRFLGQTADNEGRGRKFAVPQLFVLLVDLHGKFARGHQDRALQGCETKSATGARSRARGRQGLAGARLGGGQDVSARKCVRIASAWMAVGIVKLASANFC